ncbi:MAG: GYF domain-containing protein [Methylacidiphilales bacterium]|nr:GYF domain-containing protein [Candidatus Methylacidiphilales bacterium]
MQIYVHRNGQQLGPFSEDEIKAQLASGAISPQDSVWWQGAPGWMPLDQSPIVTGVPVVAASPSTIRTSGFAIGALISGILAFFSGCPALLCGPFVFLGLIASVLAIILGHLALSEIKKNPFTEGRGVALVGLAAGYVTLVLELIYITIIAFFITMFHGPNGTLFDQIREQLNSAQGISLGPATNGPDQSTNSANPNATPPPSTNSDSGTNAAPNITP